MQFIETLVVWISRLKKVDKSLLYNNDLTQIKGTRLTLEYVSQYYLGKAIPNFNANKFYSVQVLRNNVYDQKSGSAPSIRENEGTIYILSSAGSFVSDDSVDVMVIEI